MANITAGFLFPFSLSRTVAYKDPIRIASENYSWHGKIIGLPNIVLAGPKQLSGTVMSGGSYVERRMVLLTQGPPSVEVSAQFSIKANGTFTFDKLSPKYKYIVIDIDPNNTRRALIFDQLTPGP
jgi:hypothetical protein